MKNKIIRLAVFDLDGTLIHSPLPDTGKLIYEQKTGQKWPHKGWWGKKESLDTSVFDIETIEDVIKDYSVEAAREDTAVLMLTGRLAVLAEHVESILQAKNLKFDEHHYNTGGETCQVKMWTLDKVLKKYPDVREIMMWDDRLLHVPKFQAFGDNLIASGRIDKFSVKLVEGGQHD